MSKIAASYMGTVMYHVDAKETRTKLYNLKTTPDLGDTSPTAIDTTDLEDAVKTSIPGTVDPGTLDFTFVAMPVGATNSNVDIIGSFSSYSAGSQNFIVMMPRLNMQWALSGKTTMSLSGADIDKAGEVTMHLMLDSAPSMNALDTSYSVAYDANSGTGTLADTNSPYTLGESVTVLASTGITYADHTFSHWNTAADGTGVSYDAGDVFAIYADTTLYAIWVANA